MHLGQGDVIAAKYAVVKILGEGGMGVVYEATHIKLRQRVAVKMLQGEMLAHEVVVTRFEREARAAGQLRSRHTARVMDVDITDGGLPYIVMELLEGHDLETELRQRGRLSPAEAVDYVLQACSAMIEAHELGIVHRDLKPANLFLAVDGDARIVKVLDFGISKLASDGESKLTASDSVMGTAVYMSPEQVRSSGTVDARTDIWSLGIVLYELLSGRPPWSGTSTQLAAAIVTEDPPDILGPCGVPLALAAVIKTALQRDAAQRFVDVKALALALAPFAPSSSVGRAFADGLARGKRAPLGRSAIRAPRDEESAPTMDQAAAVSAARPRGDGTAPRWSQRAPSRSRRRTLLMRASAGFVLAFFVLGLLVFARLRGGPRRSNAAAQTATQETSPVAAGLPPSALARAPDPIPAIGDEAGVAAPASAATASAPRARPHAPGARSTGAQHPPSPPPPRASSEGNPLLL